MTRTTMDRRRGTPDDSSPLPFVGNGGPRHISRSELRASFRAGWNVVSIQADRLETNFDSSGVPAWRARIERA
jgi:hypothetical protein